MAKTKTKTIRITQVRSRIGKKPNQKATLDALGLKKINHTVEHLDTDIIRGMINTVNFLVNVEEV
jgi:large subunit ribosomal protein L30